MNIKVILSILAAVALIILIGWQATSTSTTETAQTNTPPEPVVERDQVAGDETAVAEMPAADMTDDTMEEPMEETNNVTVTEVTGTGAYVSYSSSAVADSNADTKLIFFAATWCPSCRTLDNDINDSLSDIPSDVAIFKADYDTEISLRQEHGVTTQHTIVMIDDNGTQLKKWPGGNTLKAVLAQI